jgi:hypothetical protein
MACSTVTPIKPEEQILDSVQQELAQHNQAIIDKLGETTADSGEEENPLDKDDEDDHITHTCEPIQEIIPDADEWDHEAFDKYIAAEALLPTGYQHILGKVIDRKRDIHGNPVSRDITIPS